MRAVRVTAPGAAEVVTVDEPQPAPGEVVVDVRWAGVCGTDRKRARHGVADGRIPGHEISGTLPDGTPVAVHPDIGCGTCAQCSAGWTNRCPHRQSIGIDRDGGFAERIAVPPRQLLELGDLPLHLGALLEPLACCVHAVSLLPIERVRTAAVVGAGAMGVLAMWVLQANGAKVVVSQRSPARRHLAEQLGADATVGPGDDLPEPVDAAVVTAPGTAALEWAFGNVTAGGVIHAFAGTPGGARIDVNPVHYRHLALVGSTGSTLADLRAAADLVHSGMVDLERLPRTTIGLADLPAALTGSPDPHHLRTLVAVGGDA